MSGPTCSAVHENRPGWQLLIAIVETWLLAAIITSIPCIALADDLDIDVTNLSLQELMSLDLVVTSPAKKAQKLSDAASAVYVLTNEDIRRSGATTIQDALRLVPGVQVARISAHKWAVSIRGFNSQFASKIQVLIDGRSIYSQLNAGVAWDIHNPMLEDIDRIEVIRGPGASLWGANAVNGVINIITRNANATEGNLLVAGGGNEDRVLTAFRHGGKIDEHSAYRVYGRYFDRAQGASLNGGETHDGSRGVQTGFRTDLQLSPRDQMTIQGDYFQGQEQELLDPGFLRPQEIHTRAWQYNVLGRWQHVGQAGDELSLQFYYNREQWQNDRDTPLLLNYHIDTLDLDFQHRFAMTGSQELTWGMGYKLVMDNYSDTSPIISLDPKQRNIQLFSAFLQDEITLAPGFWRVIVGSKFQHNDYTGFEFQPTIRSIWNWADRHVLWTAVSRATRTPSRVESDATVQFSSTQTSLRSTPAQFTFVNAETLRSERMLAYELGYRFQASSRLDFDLAAFYNAYDRLNNLDDIRFDPATKQLLIGTTYSGEASAWGVELAMDWRPLDSVSIKANYSYLNTRSSVLGIVSNQDTAPKHKAVLSTAYQLGRQWELDLTGRYVSRIELLAVGAYFGLDARLAWKPLDNLEISLVGQNLLDSSHPEFDERTFETIPTEIERSLYGKFRLQF